MKTIHINLLIFFYIICRSSFVSAQEAPYGLLCNLLSAPELTVITDPQPKFGWIVPEGGQSAYRILISSSKEKALRQEGDFWDSGKVLSDESVHIPYKGTELQAGQLCWWQVSVWDLKEKQSPFSSLQHFKIGDIDRQRSWPGESRWIQTVLDDGSTIWSFEDRHPISYHTVKPVKVVTRESGTVFFDFGKAAFAYASFTIASPIEQEVLIRYGEKPAGDSIDSRPGGGIIFKEYPLRLKPGEHVYQLEVPRFVSHYPNSQAMPGHMPEVIPFRFLEITLPGEDIAISNVEQQALYYRFDDTSASFTSSNDTLNAIYDLCKYSVKANTFNGDFASSQRERMMYEADTYIHQLGSYVVDREWMISRYSLENMIYHTTWPTEWVMHIPLMAWADYWYSGDASCISRYYDEIKPKTLLALANDSLLISTRTGKQSPEFLKSIHYKGEMIRDIVDWPQGTMSPTLKGGETDNYDFRDYNTVVNAFHYKALVLMARMAGVLGKTADQQFYTDRAAKVKSVFNRYFLDTTRGIYVDGIGSDHASLHANMYALTFGLVPETFRQTVVDYIKTKGMACGVYGANYLLEGMYDAGEADYALSLLTSSGDRSWYNMIRLGSTMTTEAWDNKYKSNNSWSHAWSSSPVHIIPRKLMGIEQTEAGFRKIRIKPQPASIREATTVFPTLYGAVQTSFHQQPGRSFEMEFTLPQHTEAEVWLPCAASSAELMINGKTFSKSATEGFVYAGKFKGGSNKVSLKMK